MYKAPDDKILLEAFDRAPQEVQSRLSSDEFIDFVFGLQSQRHLHIDTVGTISSMMRDLMLGLMQPADFFQNLTELVGQPVAEEITRDLNEKIFKPVRQNEESEQPRPARASVPAPFGITLPTPSPAAPVMLPGSNVPAPVNNPIQPEPVSVAQNSPRASGSSWMPFAPITKAPSVPTPMPVSPASPSTLSVSQFIAQPSPAAPVPAVEQSASAPRPSPAQQPKAPLNEYGVDPYREPVE